MSLSHKIDIGFDSISNRMDAAVPKDREYIMHLCIADLISD
jgi:hypothetical protein